MIFNSTPFVVFFTCFFILYWVVLKKNLTLQNLLILAGSYVFYGWWDWRFLSLLIGSSLLNYVLGIYIAKTTNEKKRKLLVFTGMLWGLGGLLFFKYYNFFVTSFADAFGAFNIHLDVHTLQLILPLGISFYTFRTISYLLDIDKKKLKPCTDWVVFFSYVSFFPGLISGPIDKAQLLIPQLEKQRVFDKSQFTDGLCQILWGFFKKIVIADNCATVANQIFDNYHTLPASSLVLGALFYTFQLYTDFSGYSDMAVGIARLIGFKITKNFNFPFFGQNIAEYWRRWHMSLTSWLTEYVFTPLSIKFRDYGKTGLALAIIINFTLCGIWHGANWTYVLFGFLHGLYFIPLIIKGTMNKKTKKAPKTLFPSFTEFRNIAATFILVMLTNIVFRADSIAHVTGFFKHLFSLSLFSAPVLENLLSTITILVLAIFALGVEWMQRDKEHALQFSPAPSAGKFYLRAGFICFLVWAIILWGAFGNKTFIYFQF
jgi:alginate O-acetyltransferase complex protein AlgI